MKTFFLSFEDTVVFLIMSDKKNPLKCMPSFPFSIEGTVWMYRSGTFFQNIKMCKQRLD